MMASVGQSSQAAAAKMAAAVASAEPSSVTVSLTSNNGVGSNPIHTGSIVSNPGYPPQLKIEEVREEVIPYSQTPAVIVTPAPLLSTNGLIKSMTSEVIRNNDKTKVEVISGYAAKLMDHHVDNNGVSEAKKARVE